MDFSFRQFLTARGRALWSWACDAEIEPGSGCEEADTGQIAGFKVKS